MDDFHYFSKHNAIICTIALMLFYEYLIERAPTSGVFLLNWIVNPE